MQLQQQLQRSTLHKRTAGTAAYVKGCHPQQRSRLAAASSRRAVVSCRCSAEAAAVQDTAAAPAPSSSSTAEPAPQSVTPAAAVSSVPDSDIIELDFCSRPLLDERGKKVWELLVCSPDRSFEYSQYFPNNKINSAEVRLSIVNRYHTVTLVCIYGMNACMGLALACVRQDRPVRGYRDGKSATQRQPHCS